MAFDFDGAQNDATAYGGKDTGFDASYNQPDNSFSDPWNYQSTVNWGDDFDMGSPASLGDMFGGSYFNQTDYSGSLGNMYGNSFAGTPRNQTFGEQVSDFLETPFGKIARGVAGMTPLGALANMGYNLSKGNYGALASGLIGGPVGTIAGLGINAAMGKASPGSVGSTLGGLGGGMVAGPVGSLAGSMLGGNMFSGSGGYTGGYTDGTGLLENSGGGGFNGADYGQMAGLLASMYTANQGRNDASKAASSAADSTNASLESMFGPNSAAAQQMRQQLDRRDAAAGRRSQYGPREVELQAALAKLKANAYPGMVNAGVNASKAQLEARHAQRLKQNQTLGALMALGKNTGAFGKLADMFGNQSAPNISAGDFGQLPEGYNAFAGNSAFTNNIAAPSFDSGGDSSDWWDEY